MRIYIYSIIAILLLVGSAQAATLSVCHSGCGYSSIQAAINAASPGDIIDVYSGTYHEEVAINKDVTLKPVNTGEDDIGIDTVFLCGHSDALSRGFLVAVVLPICPGSPGSPNVRVSNNTVTIGPTKISGSQQNTQTKTKINKKLAEAEQRLNKIATDKLGQVNNTESSGKINTGFEKTLTVCQSGCDYTTIQAAIDDASPGDIILVHSGGYKEQVFVNKDITLRGIDIGGGEPVVKIISLCGHPESVISDIKYCVMKSDCSDNSGSNINCPGLS